MLWNTCALEHLVFSVVLSCEVRTLTRDTLRMLTEGTADRGHVPSRGNPRRGLPQQPF